MLSRYTYALWNLAIAVLTVLYAAGNLLRGTYWLAGAEGFMVLVFLSFAVMAYFGKGMFYKHPITFKPNGEVVAKELKDD